METSKYECKFSTRMDEREGLILFVQPGQFVDAGPESVIRHARDAMERGAFGAALGDTYTVPAADAGSLRAAILVGLGKEPDIHTLRTAAAHAARAVRRERLRTVTLVPPAVPGAELPARVRVMAEGYKLGDFTAKTYASSAQEPPRAVEAAFFAEEGENTAPLREAAYVGGVYADAVNYARDLTNVPGNLHTPQDLANEALGIAKQFGFGCEVLDEGEIERKGMGGLYAVGRGSANPPRMITLTYQGQPEWKDVLGLVGKGITFDTGGISIKPAAGMEEMISDMGGAAVLLGLMRAVGELKPKVNLVVVIPAAENMVSGAAFRPGDVLTTLSGKTVEVLNTDAEGRIVLADGMTYAIRRGAVKLIDVATLTGAVLVALGDVTTAAVTNNEALLQEVMAASRKSGEYLWQLPSFPEYWDMLKSNVADVKNATNKSRWAAVITAGLFIGTFAEGLPWVHLDTGGTAWLWSERGVDPTYGTGAMTRTLLEYISGGA